MISVKINGKDYQIKNDWKDITIQEAASVLNIKIPDSLKKCYDVSFQSSHLPEEEYNKKVDEVTKEISIEDQFKAIPGYFSEVLEVLSDIPHEVVLKTDVVSIKTLYHSYLKPVVEGMYFTPMNYKPIDITYFDFEGERFLLPTNKTIFGKSVPMADISALEFTESADLLIHVSAMTKDRDFARVANLISILCRPEGEEYNEKVSLERAERFKKLTMDLTWDVFFSLIAPLVIAGQSVLISSLQKEVQKGKDQQT
jgi:hypothetical protein